MTRGSPPPCDDVPAYHMCEVLYNSHTAYMMRYIARAGQEAKGLSPYGSLEEARGARGSDFHWKNVHFRDVGGVLSYQTHAGEWIPVDSEPLALRAETGGNACEIWHFVCPHWS